MTKAKMQFGDLCERAWRKLWEGTKNAPSQRSILKKLLADFGETTVITRITTRKIDTISQQWLDEGASEKTANRRLSALSRMFKWAERRGDIEKAPYIDRYREGPGRVRVVTEMEEDLLLERMTQADQVIYADIVAILVDSGMRRGVLLSIRWTQISDGWVSLEDTKSGKPRRVPLTLRAQECLSRHEDHPGGPFLHIAESTFSAVWNKHKEAMGITDPGFVPHALRHTFASRLLDRRADLFTVSKLLGHTSIKTTADVYGHFSPDLAQDAIALLEPVELTEEYETQQ